MTAGPPGGAPAAASTAPVLPVERIDLNRYDRTPSLRAAERAALVFVVEQRAQRPHPRHWPASIHRDLARLRVPIADVLDAVGVRGVQRYATAAILQAAMHERQSTYWAWSRTEWLEVFEAHVRRTDCRQQVLACVYLLGGAAAIPAATGRIQQELRRWGWTEGGAMQLLHRTVSALLLARRSPHLEDLTPQVVEAVWAGTPSTAAAAHVLLVARALVSLGILQYLPAGLPAAETDDPWSATSGQLAGAPAEWAGWCRRWYQASTLTPSTRRSTVYLLLKTGRWLATTYPEMVDPAAWTREVAAAYVAAVDRLTHGAWVQTPAASRFAARVGQPLSAHARLHHLRALRGFFRDLQEWGWIPRRFDPGRALAGPRSLRAAAGPAPRVIADDVWAKLLWAGLNVEAADLPTVPLAEAPWYPVELVRALSITWLFAGLRWDELRRLQVGCIRWQRGDAPAAGPSAGLPMDAVCWLDVPVNKTLTAFTKPVDRVVGEAIATWEAVRPAQPALADPKTGEAVHYLFLHRGRRLGPRYLNKVLIPAFCRKAGVPLADARGRITSHRARSTIASQLYNAKEPMSLFELQAWLGHRSPHSTQHYARITPTTLAKAYSDAGYFARNVRTIEVLVDRDAVQSGAAAQGQPWQYFDLAHGYCTYSFFEQCPHRMACARCDFYLPKGSTAAQLLEARANLRRMLAEIPLTDEERAAVEDGTAAMERLMQRLADTPTPAGRPPARSRPRPSSP